MVARFATGDHGLLHSGLNRVVASIAAMGEDGIDEEDEDEESINVRQRNKLDDISTSSKKEKQQNRDSATDDQQVPSYQRVVNNCIAFLGVIFIVRFASQYDIRLLD